MRRKLKKLWLPSSFLPPQVLSPITITHVHTLSAGLCWMSPLLLSFFSQNLPPHFSDGLLMTPFLIACLVCVGVCPCVWFKRFFHLPLLKDSVQSVQLSLCSPIFHGAVWGRCAACLMRVPSPLVSFLVLTSALFSLLLSFFLHSLSLSLILLLLLWPALAYCSIIISCDTLLLFLALSLCVSLLSSSLPSPLHPQSFPLSVTVNDMFGSSCALSFHKQLLSWPTSTWSRCHFHTVLTTTVSKCHRRRWANWWTNQDSRLYMPVRNLMVVLDTLVRFVIKICTITVFLSIFALVVLALSFFWTKIQSHFQYDSHHFPAPWNWVTWSSGWNQPLTKWTPPKHSRSLVCDGLKKVQCFKEAL